MDSKIYQSCNKCRIGIAEAVQEAFNRGFNILNRFKRSNSVHANKQVEDKARR